MVEGSWEGDGAGAGADAGVIVGVGVVEDGWRGVSECKMLGVEEEKEGEM